MDDITIGVTENVNLISVTAQPNDQIIDIAVTETVETVLLDVSTTVQEVSVTATQNVIVENITVDYVNNENNIDINVTDATQDVTLNVTPTLIEINILRSGGEVNILQFNSLADFPTTGSSDYFYLAKDTNKLYRWTGSAYAEISATSSPVWGQIIGTLSEQTDLQNALNLKAPINSPTFTGTVSGITKTMVGLGAVDNTSDLDKPISTATQAALNAKQPLDADLTSIAALSGTYGFLKKTNENSYSIDTNTYLTGITSSDVTTALGFTPENVANKGIANGYASLNGDGKVPSSQLPSYVDDVIEVSSYGTLPATGETGKIYITLDTNKIYRWSGSVYVEVSSSDAVWGAITGTLSNQTDLQNALDAKLNVTTAASTYYLASNPNGYTSNTGTVTSVAMTVPSAFSVSGSPITSSGTLAVTATGNTTQYIAGDGSLVTFPTIGTAGTLIREVRNTTGATLTKGTVVYISGATGNKPTVSKAIATGDSTSAQTFGLVQADIANNANGNVVCAGDLTGIDTSTLTEGVQLYLSSTTAGAYTTTKQLAPNHLVYIGIVTRAHPTLGQIEVNIQNGYELYELHDVSITSVANNDGLFYEASTDLWKNKSIATVLGYTPANGADYMALTGSQSIAGTKTFTGFGLFENTIFIKQDSSVSFLAGYNSIDSDTTGIIFSLPAGNMAKFVLTSLTASRDYTLPNASGTIALTSDIPSLSGYVTTTGDQSISGTKTFTTQLHANVLKFSESGGFNQTAGFTQIGGTANYFSFANGTNAKSAQFTYGTGTAFNLPNSNGTLALTSQLHDAVTIGTANGLSLSTQVLSLGLASSSTNGALSSTDWNTFNGKQNALTNPVTGTGTTSYLPKFTGTSAIGNSLLYDTGSVLLVGATSASDGQSKLELVSASTVGLKIISSGVNGNNTFLSIQANKEWRFVTNRGDLISGNQGDLIIRNNTDGINHIILNQSGSTTFAGALNGTSATFSGAVTSTLAYSNTSDLSFVGSANIPGVNLRSSAGGRISIVTGYIGANISSILVGTGTNNPTTEALRIIHSTGAATFSSSVTAGSTSSGAQINVYASSYGNNGLFNAYGTDGNIKLQMGGLGTNEAFIYTGASNKLSIFTGGATSMTITSSGNVGIGTTAPNSILEIAATTPVFRIQASDSANFHGIEFRQGAGFDAFIKQLPSTGEFRISNGRSVGWGGHMTFYTDTAERMRLTSGGNVGIGTTSVLASVFTLQVGNGGADTRALFNPNNPYAISVRNGASSLWYIGVDAQTAANGLQFYANELGASAMTIKTSGNVGIGTTSPSGASGLALAINGGANQTRIALKNSTTGDAAGNGLQILLDAGSLDAAIENRENGHLRFATGGSERMRITSTGNSTVLIGNSSSIWGTTNRGVVEINGTGSSLLGLKANGAEGGYVYFNGTNIYFQNQTSGGNLYIQSGNSGGVVLSAGATAWSSTSDERLKNINSIIDNATEKLMSLRAVNFSWKSDKTNKENLGLIAQDVENVLPQVIDRNKLNTGIVNNIDETEYLSVRYTDLVPVLVKAIQELKAELDTLKNK